MRAVDKSGLAPITRRCAVLAQTPDGPLLMRCMAMPGDTFELRDGEVMIDGRGNCETPYALASYKLLKDVPYASRRHIAQEAGVSMEQADTLVRLNPASRSAQWGRATYAPLRPNEQDQRIFPWDVAYQWNAYQMGPFRLPRHGDRIPLDFANVKLYGPLVRRWEGKTLEVTPMGSHTFAEDYVMCLCDDRDVINDSRLYGPLPKRLLRRVVDE